MPDSVAAEDPDARIELHDLEPHQASMASEVLAGLRASPKKLPPKYFYDETGSHLFDAITGLDEYYPTRTETALLTRHGREIAELAGERSFLIEYGSGSAVKVRRLLETLRPVGYMPIDISREHLLASARALAARFAWLRLYPTCADYAAPVPLPSAAAGRQTMAFFPGSSIGNFSPVEARHFLGNVARTVGEGGYLLIGVDRKKDVATLERAYNDAQGVTAAFNLNIIDHINAALDGTLDREAFRHRAHYNAAAGRIEMHLECVRDHSATVAGTRIAFAAGEHIHTESSYKYHPQEFSALASAGGFEVVRHWSDPRAWFSVFLCRSTTPKMGTCLISNRK